MRRIEDGPPRLLSLVSGEAVRDEESRDSSLLLISPGASLSPPSPHPSTRSPRSPSIPISATHSEKGRVRACGRRQLSLPHLNTDLDPTSMSMSMSHLNVLPPSAPSSPRRVGERASMSTCCGSGCGLREGFWSVRIPTESGPRRPHSISLRTGDAAEI